MDLIAIALLFLKAVESGDIEAAMAHCKPTAEFAFLPSLGGPQPMASGLDMLKNQIFTAFDEDGLTLTVTRTLSSQDFVVVEFTGTATLKTGKPYTNFYSMNIAFEGDKIQWARPFTDTLLLNNVMSEQ
ncbi:MAG: nuclear transport factor 2 family protein [Pseudomonadota bacterium]